MPEVFWRAFQKFVDETDALRAVFKETEASPRQYFQAVTIPVETHDFSSLSDPEKKLETWIEEQSQRNFDLEKTGLHCALLKLDEEVWVWYLNLHHIIMDAWSCPLIFDHVAAIYSQFLNNKTNTYSPLPQYQDYLSYESKKSETEQFLSSEKYWDKKVREASDKLSLYGEKLTDHQPFTVRETVYFGPKRFEQLKALELHPKFRGISQHLTRFNLLTTVIIAYLYRVTGQNRITVGTPSHNRTTLDFRSTVGLFIEVLPLTVELEATETFDSLFGKVSGEMHQLLKNSSTGVSNTKLAKSFNVVINYIHAEFGNFSSIESEANWLHSGYGDPSHDLRIQLHDLNAQGEFCSQFDFNEALLDTEHRRLACNHYLQMVDAFLTDPSAQIDQVDLTTAAEKQYWLTSYNGSSDPNVAQGTVLDTFRKQVVLAPDSPVLYDNYNQLTYAELDHKTDALAKKLLAHGIKSAEPVGVLLERSIEFVVSILAVLKAGGCFVPIEYRTPDKRLESILSDAGVTTVISNLDAAMRLSNQGVTAFLYDTEAFVHQNDYELPEINDNSPAYVIYTSGSTGIPKGVVVRHDALKQYISWAFDTFTQSQRSDFPLYSSVGFDLTITSLFVPLVSGGLIKVYPEASEGSDLSVLDVFQDDDVDVVKLTPSHLDLVLESGISIKRIKSLILGGEDLKTDLALRANRTLDGINIYNEYGPTEGVVGNMVYLFNPDVDKRSSVPIGYPSPRNRIYLLDKGMNLVPKGVTGEIYIAGHFIADCYLNNQVLTSDKFLEDPFYSGFKMYKTGDIGRLSMNGGMEYLGRIDDQVKIGGVRVELSEIVNAINTFDGIRQSFVRVVDNQKKISKGELKRCGNCGLGSDYPGIQFDQEGICNICNEFEQYKDRADIYFGDIPELRSYIDQAKLLKKGKYDCISLLSGGKDSTYALCRMAELTDNILAVTLDNGYISEEAKSNITQVTGSLGIDHIFVSTPEMDQIFVDSLNRHSNVCHGCFKAIYTLAVNIAVRDGIPFIVTGLSRGQFFETRLTPDVFMSTSVTLDAIEQTVLEARKAYHRVDDAVYQLLDVEVFKDDAVFDQVQFIDFYRYCDVDLAEVYRYLSEKTPWKRPSDTGRSTNCLINDVGIFVHKQKEGFHNYALPYSWDVRMGHKERDQALDELDDEIDLNNVREILDEIGYGQDFFNSISSSKKMVAYYSSDSDVDDILMRKHLSDILPHNMLPHFLVQVEEFPLTANGKINQEILPVPTHGRDHVKETYVSPVTETEKVLVKIWQELLGLSKVGITDNYYSLGGDSISAIHISSKAKESGFSCSATDIFKYQTVSELAAYLDEHSGAKKANQVKDNLDPGKFTMANLDEDKLRALKGLLSRD